MRSEITRVVDNLLTIRMDMDRQVSKLEEKGKDMSEYRDKIAAIDEGIRLIEVLNINNVIREKELNQIINRT